MAEPPVPSLSRAREQKIAELSTHFANDDLSLEDLERRIERVYKAVSVAELESIPADLRSPAALVDPRAEPARGRVSLGGNAPVTGTLEAARSRLVAFMSSTRRVGRWAVPRDMSVFALMSDTRLDLTS